MDPSVPLISGSGYPLVSIGPHFLYQVFVKTGLRIFGKARQEGKIDPSGAGYAATRRGPLNRNVEF